MTRHTLSIIFFSVISLSGFTQKYELVENIKGFETKEIITIIGELYEHEIYNDQLCYSYWTKSYGKCILQIKNISLLEPDSIIYSNNTKIFRNEAKIEILNPDSDWDLVSRINIDKKYRFEKKCTENRIGVTELPEINCKYSMLMPDSTLNKLSNYPQGFFLEKIGNDFSALKFIKKKNKLIPIYKRWKPTGGQSSRNFIIKQ